MAPEPEKKDLLAYVGALKGEIVEKKQDQGAGVEACYKHWAGR